MAGATFGSSHTIESTTMKLLTNKPRRSWFGSHSFRYLLNRIQNLEITMAATQEEVDALTTEVTTVGESLATAKTNIEQEFATLETQITSGTPANELDLTALKTAVDGLGTPSTELENLKPVAPGEAVDPTADNPTQSNPPAATSEEAARDAV